MEELSEDENVSLLKADGGTRKARSKGSDPVKELRGPILAPACNKVCPICADSLDKTKVPLVLWLLQMVFGLERSQTWRSGPFFAWQGTRPCVNCSSSYPNFILTELIL